MRSVVAGPMSVGIDVIEVGIVPAPTVEVAVKPLKAAGGSCSTATHNPSPRNALKFFNKTGEFITPQEYKKLDRIFTKGEYASLPTARLGSVEPQLTWVDDQIKCTLAVRFVNRPAIKRRKFRVVVDAINGAGSTALPALLRKLGVTVIELNCKGNGDFVREPEPVPKKLRQLGAVVQQKKADLGLACYPDTDRLALVDENGKPIGEELTLAIAIRQVLQKASGPAVINLSNSRVTDAVARVESASVHYSKVGEANVAQETSRRRATVGGEGNGGVILPLFHAGRGALITAALVLSQLAEQKEDLSSLVSSLPTYYNKKTKALLPDDFSTRLERFEQKAPKLLGKVKIDRRDGIRMDFNEGWVQIRSSNTEPIFRLIVETQTKRGTDRLVKEVKALFS